MIEWVIVTVLYPMPYALCPMVGVGRVGLGKCNVRKKGRRYREG